MASHASLAEEIGDCAAVERPDGTSDVLIICEHASNAIPESLGTLGLSPEVLTQHIAWDPGALATAMILSERLDATLVHQRVSRLVYDCNRPPSSPTAMPARSEIYDIPGNQNLSDADRQARVTALYEPFHRKIADLIATRTAKGQRTIVVTVHSFTPVYHGKPRAVELGILHDSDTRLADSMLASALAAPEFLTMRNEPYGPADGVTHTLQLHGIRNGVENVMIEFRNDLIADERGQQKAATCLERLLTTYLER